MEVIVSFAAFGFGIWIGWRLLDILTVRGGPYRLDS